MTQRRFSVEPGQRFGRLVVQEEVLQKPPSSAARWAARCLCDCGAEVTVLLQNLKARTRSCGCLKRKGTMSDAFRSTRGAPRLFSVVPGQRFERLVVLREEQKRLPSGQLRWFAQCLCDCDQQTTVLQSNLRQGIARSCGCLQSERAAEANARRATHGVSDHQHYPRWRNMMQRCYDPQDSHYANYGGRGISVHQEWHDARAFVTYLEEALGPRPEGHSLDRIDNNGNYEPGNVRWANALTQRHNQRRRAGKQP